MSAKMNSNLYDENDEGCDKNQYNVDNGLKLFNYNDNKPFFPNEKNEKNNKIVALYKLNFVLYKELRYHLLSMPLFRQKNLSYMNCPQAANGSKEHQKDSAESQNSKINFVLKSIKLDPIEGFKYAFVDIFIINRFSTTDSHKKVFVGTTEIYFDGKFSSIDVPFELIKSCNSNYKVGILIRFNNKEKSRESRCNEKSTLLTESSPNISINNEQIFSCACEFNKDFVGDYTLKLAPVNNRKININPIYDWVDVEDDDIFIDSSDSIGNENICLTDTFLKNIQLEENKFFNFQILQSENPCSFLSINSYEILSQLSTTKLIDNDDSKNLSVNVLFSFKDLQFNTYISGFICFFCKTDYHSFKTLITHLQACHERFSFECSSNNELCKIEVNLNVHIDSNDLNPLKKCYLSYASRKCGPIKKKPLTTMFVSNSKRSYLKDFNGKFRADLACVPHFRENHNKRVYYHSQTCGPILPSELDINSEDEEYPDWIKQKTISMIDDFSDVNIGEKEIAKMWNFHVMKYSKNVVGDVQIPSACELFIKEHGEEILRKKLKFNLILHLCNLDSFGLISPALIDKLSSKLDILKYKNN